MATSMRAVRLASRYFCFRSFSKSPKSSNGLLFEKRIKFTTDLTSPPSGSLKHGSSKCVICRLDQKRNFCAQVHTERNCWRCGVSNRCYEELFFCKCGIVQKLPDDVTYFDLLNSELKFDIDTDRLSQVYRHLQTKLHPDKFTLKSKEEQDLAEKQSAFINKAYFTLLKPLSRGLYLLEIWGDPLTESSSTVDQDFLLEMMELNEDIDAAKTDLTELKTLEDINNAQMDSCIKEVSEYFQNKKISAAKSCLIKLKYLNNIGEKIKDIYRSHMDV